MRQIHYSAWLLVGLSSLLQVLIFPLPGLYVLSWVAFAPLIVALLRARPRVRWKSMERSIFGLRRRGRRFCWGTFPGFLWFAGTCYWIYDTMHEHGGLSVPAAGLALFLFCLYLGLYHGFFGLLVGLAPARDGTIGGL